MFKLLILLTVAALSSASDYGKLVGEWKVLDRSKSGPACVGFSILESGDKCICDGKEIPFLSIKVPDRESEILHFLAVFVKSDDEVEAAQEKKAKGCTCGEKTWVEHVFKVISENYVVAYAEPYSKSHESILFVKAGVSKPDFETFIKNSDYKSKILPCDMFSS